MYPTKVKDRMRQSGEMKTIQCPYFFENSRYRFCTAYRETLMMPSIFEEKNFCKAVTYIACDWYIQKYS
jgi:hypothetical protein